MRKIIHIDMDAFFASIEQRDRPELRGKPVIVGGDPDKRGVVSACSYEARKFGVHSAMPGKQAVRQCPQGIFLPVNMVKYRQVSARIQAIFRDVSDLVEPLSLDEAFIDVTQNKLNNPSATLLAKEIKKRIHEQIGLTASAGVSYNKFLAKVASDYQKPDGLTVITPDQAESFIEQLPIGKFHGIGRVTAEKLKNIGVRHGRDLKKIELPRLLEQFGKAGRYYYYIVRGIDEREVESEWERKSLGREITLEEDISSLDQIVNIIDSLAARVAEKLQQYELRGKTVTLKIRYEDFQTVTRSQSFSQPDNHPEFIFAAACKLLEKTEAGARKVRLVGVTVSGFPGKPDDSIPVQLEFPF